MSEMADNDIIREAIKAEYDRALADLHNAEERLSVAKKTINACISAGGIFGLTFPAPRINGVKSAARTPRKARDGGLSIRSYVIALMTRSYPHPVTHRDILAALKEANREFTLSAPSVCLSTLKKEGVVINNGAGQWTLVKAPS